MMQKIDAHHHCWHYQQEKHAWIDDSMQVIQRDFFPADLLPALEDNGVTGTVLVQVEMEEGDNDFSLAMAAQADFIKGIVGWIDLFAPDIRDRLQQWREKPLMKGFRHIAQAEPDDFLARPEVIRGIGEIGKAGFTYDILIKPPQMGAAIQLIQALPDQPFVVDHMAKPYIAAGEMEPWKQHIKALAENPHVCCKISGMVTEADWHSWTYEQLAPYLYTVLEAFGPDRLMFGSDWPVCLVAAPYHRWVQVVEQFVSPLSLQEQQAIWYGNATRFYKL